ncbi:hypothetical protein LT493_01995 [Streptomyces tricolor]|nr:hypothetical protein [Streptomyces tricolor]
MVAATAVAAGGYFVYRSWFADDPACAPGGVRARPPARVRGGHGRRLRLRPLAEGGHQAYRGREQMGREADRGAGTSPATIALMIPMISDNPAEQREYVEQVEGAYLAQYRANHNTNRQPPIRLPARQPRPWLRALARGRRATGTGRVRREAEPAGRGRDQHQSPSRPRRPSAI